MYYMIFTYKQWCNTEKHIEVVPIRESINPKKYSATSSLWIFSGVWLCLCRRAEIVADLVLWLLDLGSTSHHVYFDSLREQVLLTVKYI